MPTLDRTTTAIPTMQPLNIKSLPIYFIWKTSIWLDSSTCPTAETLLFIFSKRIIIWECEDYISVGTMWPENRSIQAHVTSTLIVIMEQFKVWFKKVNSPVSKETYSQKNKESRAAKSSAAWVNSTHTWEYTQTRSRSYVRLRIVG